MKKNNKVYSLLALLVLFAAMPFALYNASQQTGLNSKASTNLTTNAGRPFADNSAWNQPIGSNVQIDPNSAAIVSMLASGKQGASLYDFGTPIFFANASTPKYSINCTEDWGICGLEAEQVPIPADARQAPGSDAQMVIIDLSGRKSYEFWVYKNDKASANWGAVLPLDGDGRGTAGNSAIGAGISRIAGIIRAYEIEKGVIDHALVFSTKFCQGPTNSSNFRFPATKTDGKYSGAGAIPEGARVQLDPSIDVNSIAGISKGEKAVAIALQKYGAYAVDCGGAEMAIQFENPIGKNDPYPAAGLTNDYFEFDKIPWTKLRVLKEWNSYTPALGGIAPTINPATSGPEPTNIAPSFVCLTNEPCTTPVPSQQAGTIPPGGANPGTPPVGGTNPIPGNPGTNPQPCPTDGTTNVFHNKKKVKSGGGFIEQFIKFIIRLIELFFKLLGISIPNPGQIPQPNPDPGTEPAPCPEPTNVPEPTTAPEPTAAPSPTIFTPPTVTPIADGFTPHAPLPAGPFTSCRPNITIDTTAAPALDIWLRTKVVPTLQDWYPYIVDTIATPGYTARCDFQIVLANINVPAHADFATGKITADITWTTNHPEDMGMFIHEATHTIQAYTKARPEGWIVEGIADGVRDYLYKDRVPTIPSASHYFIDGYSETAYMFNHIKNTYDASFIRKLNVASHNGTYNYDIFFQTTNKQPDQLWKEATGRTVPAGGITGLGNKCIDIPNSITQDGARLQLFGCNNASAQRWSIAPSRKSPTARRIVARGKCMDIAQSGTADGTAVWLYSCNGGNAQEWIPQTNGTLMNPIANKCLSAENSTGTDGTRLIIATCNAALSQQIWQIPR
ncbi:MAG: ricin-type beta-trefoil lectin domain protein [Candidatus Levybacteria bacterium]|nr:ricin-type beta-trefoil lectin domain protein [Candidatus Levybacteria bacterium]